MRSLAFRTPAGALRLLAGLALTTATLTLLALLPTASSAASAPSVTLPPSGEVESLLAKTPLGTLTAGKLAEVLAQAPGLEHVESATLEQAVEKVLAQLTAKGATLEELLHGEGAAKLEQTLHELLGPLGGLLGTNPRAKIEEALSSTPAGELIGKLLGGSPEPQALLAQILQSLPAEKLQQLLGSLPTGEPVVRSTVEELAHQLATTGETLAGDFGDTVEQLPGTTMTLTTPLKDGETLAAVNAAKGVTLATIKSAQETVGSTGGTGAPGSPGAPGSSGSAGSSSGSVTVTASGTQPAAPSGTVAGIKQGKLRVISHKVKRLSATIVLEVPSAGKLTATGRGASSISRETEQAERVTLHPSLTKASTSSLRKHRHKKVTVPLKIAFKQVGGATSTVTVSLAFT